MRLFKDIFNPLALLTFIAFMVMPYQALAEEPPWFVSPSSSLTIIHPTPAVDYLYDQTGHSATVVTPFPGLRWYSAQDPQGRITAQGYLFDPLPASKPLTMSSSMRPLSTRSSR